MADNTINIKVTSEIEKLTDLRDRAQESGAFKGPGGQEALTRINGFLTTLDRLTKAGDMSAEDWTKAVGVIRNIYKDLEHFSAKAVKLSPALEKLYGTLNKKEAELNKKSEKLVKATTDRTEVAQKIKNLAAEKQVSFHKTTSKGNIVKSALIDPETILKNYQAGTLALKNKDGTEIKDKAVIDSYLKDLSKEYQDYSVVIQNTKRELEELITVVDGLNAKIKTQTAADKQTGASSNPDILADVTTASHSFNKEVNKAQEQNANSKAKAVTLDSDSIKPIEKTTNAWGKAFKAISVYNLAIKGLKTAWNAAKQTVVELDKYLSEQAMVTGKTRQETYALLGSYQDLAKQCGATTKEIAEVATEYMKQGKTIEDSLVLTEAAVKAAKVARVSVGDSVNYLTTALNGFRLSADQAMTVSDKFAAVAAASATDYDELAIALSKVASQANLAGMSIDYTTALLTKGLETTREAPETMGTALKTIIARMRELSDYGETLDDSMDINNVESQLKYVGIALRDSNGELRSTEDVLDELGHKWDTLNKNQQAAIAKALAGTRQQSRLIAMMEDYERVTELQEISQRSTGATAAQADVYVNSLAGAINRVQSAWEGVVSAFTDSDIIIKVVNMAEKALNGISDILKTTGGQVAVFSTLGLIGATIIGNKLRENALAKEQQRVAAETASIENQRLITEKETAFNAAITARNKAELAVSTLEESKIKAIQNIDDEIANKKDQIAEKEKLKGEAQLNIKKWEGKILDEESHQADLEKIKKAKELAILQKEELAREWEKAKLWAAENGDEAYLKIATEEAAKAKTEAEQAKNSLSTDKDYVNATEGIKKSENKIKNYQGRITHEKNNITTIDNEIAGINKDIGKLEGSKKTTAEEYDKQIATQKEIAQAKQEEAEWLNQDLNMLEQKQALLDNQLSTIKMIGNGLTGWLAPVKSFGENIFKTIGFFKDFKKNVAKMGSSLKNAFKPFDKGANKRLQLLKKTTKATKESAKANKEVTKTEEKEAAANLKTTATETAETAANTAGTTAETAEAAANTASTTSETTETAANTAATVAETAETTANTAATVAESSEAAANTASTTSEVAETGASIGAAAADTTEAAASTTAAIANSAESAAKIPYVGWAIAIGFLALLGIAGAVAGGMAIANAAMMQGAKGAEVSADNINKLSGEIFSLTERANALDNIADSFDKIDSKVIKTKADMEEMESLLESAADQLSDDVDDDEDIGYGKGVSAKEAYEALTRQEDKIAFIEAEAQRNRDEANKKRQEQLKIFNSANEMQKELLLYGTDSRYVNARSALYAINNNALYEHIDALKELEGADEDALQATESLVQSLLEEMDAEKALALANEENQETIKNLVKELNDLESTAVFTDEDQSFTDRVKAFRELQDALADQTDMLEALNSAYSEWNTFAQMGDEILYFIEATNLSIDQINELYGAYAELQKAGLDITKEEYQDSLETAMSMMESDLSNFEDVIATCFKDVLADAEDFDAAWNSLVSSIGDTFATGILDMGQNMESFNNTINNFYEKASEWADLTESEKMEFLADNAELFSGEGGADLLQAFESGNYNAIESALNTQLADRQEKQLAEIRRTLAVEEARVGEDRNEAYIAALKQYEQHLMDTNNLYKASLDLRLEQEEAQIEKYREYLEQQQEALTESLEKRKEAYEKYFESINQEQEDEDYEEEATRLIDNITKLSSSTNADAMQQTAELQQELEELEEERLQELRERAQEAVIENIDTTIEEINDKFDKLLDSNQALLLAMQGELDNPLEFMTDMIVSQAGQGATALELEQYLQDLQGTYGNIIGNDVFENMSVREENGQLILNVHGQEITLNQGDEQSIFTAVMDALRAVGLK